MREKRMVIFALGSRGDVQPYIALAVALRQLGQPAQVAAPEMFRELAAEAGVPFISLGNLMNPQELVKHPEVQAAAHRGGQLRALLTILRIARPLMTDLLTTVGKQAREADSVIAPSIPFGVLDSALAHEVPVAWASLHAFLPTRTFPNAFWAPLGPRLNHPLNPLTHRAMQAALFLGWGNALNRWRTQIGLSPTSLGSYFAEIERRRIPTVYGFSPAVLPRPNNYPAHHFISGYWFLDPPQGWQPPADLERFLEAGAAPLAIGFGSMDNQQPERLTAILLDAIAQSGQRAILIAGWAGIGTGGLPPTVLRVESIAHAWLFPQAAAVIHHGGAGTTAAGLRAGVPTIIAPFAADQFFWAQRIADLQVGVAAPRIGRLSAQALAQAIERTLNNPAIAHHAAQLGAQIAAERGAERAAEYLLHALDGNAAEPAHLL